MVVAKNQAIELLGIGELERLIDQQLHKQVTKEESAIPISAIKVHAHAFQPRDDWNSWEQEAHIRTLAKAIKKGGKAEPLEPITVVPVLGEYLVLDGHLRLLAYKEAGWPENKPIPVNVFRGPSSEALKFAIEANSRDKLPLTMEQKLQAAWRMVCHSEVHREQHGKPCFSQREIASAAAVSNGSVANASKTLQEYLKTNPLMEAVEMTYTDVKKGLREMTDETVDIDDLRDGRVKDYANRLGKTFGKRLQRDSDIFVEALEVYSERAYTEVMRYMVARDMERVSELLEEMNEEF